MAYITGTISSANPALDLYTAIAAALTTAGYTQVDTVVISTRTHQIWKSAAANNTTGKDWYVDLVYAPSGGTTFRTIPMEFYDPATDLAYRMVHGGSSAGSVIESTYWSRYGATGATLESASWTFSAAQTTGTTMTLTTGSFGYWVSVTGDRIIIMHSQAPTLLGFAGFYEPLDPHKTYAGADAYPLVECKIDNTGFGTPTGTTSSTKQALTRLPKSTVMGATSGYNWGFIPTLQPFLDVAGGSGYIGGATRVPDGTTGVLGGRYAVPILIGAASGGATNQLDAPVGFLGKLNDVAVVPVISTVVRGDTVTVAGATWVLGTVSGSTAVLFRAA